MLLEIITSGLENKNTKLKITTKKYNYIFLILIYVNQTINLIRKQELMLHMGFRQDSQVQLHQNMHLLTAINRWEL